MRSAIQTNNEPFLDSFETVHIPATTVPFVARENFVVGPSIQYVGQGFSNWFLAGDGLIEEPADASTLEVATLKVSSADGPVIKEIGGVLLVQTRLAQVFSILSLLSVPRIDSGRHVFFVPQPVATLDGPYFSYTNGEGELVTEKVSSPEYLFPVEGQWYVLRSVCVRLENDTSLVNSYAIDTVGRWPGQSLVYYH
jgi:hypothetical protein